MPNAPQHALQSHGNAYFDNSDETSSTMTYSLPSSSSSASSDNGNSLSWRGDPEDTLSDCSIVVVTNELKATTYHTHKSVLCFGPRQSRYFARVILKESADGKKKKKYRTGRSRSPKRRGKKRADESDVVPSVKVELDDRDALNFPILLDFLYSQCTHMMLSHDGTLTTANSTCTATTSLGSLLTSVTSSDDENSSTSGSNETEIQLTTKNALSLRYLAKKFEVDAFITTVNRFIQKDLSFKTGPAYLLKGWEYRDERIMESARKLCAENFEQIDTRALIKLPSSLFRVVVEALESFETENEKLSLFLSDVVCRYLEKNPTSLNAQFLLEMTDPLLMPCISSEAAIGFTALTKELEPDDVTDHWDGLVTLCRRCARAVVQEYGWSDFSVNGAADEYLRNSGRRQQQPQSNGRLSICSEISFSGGAGPGRLDSLLFATSFAAALQQAQEDYETIMDQQEQLQTTVGTLHDTIETMESVNKLKDQHMQKQKEVIEEAKRQILALKKQIGEIKDQQRPQYVLPAAPREIHTSAFSTNSNMLSPEEIVRDLISPSQVEGKLMAARRENKNNKVLKTKEEMRARSLL